MKIVIAGYTVRPARFIAIIMVTCLSLAAIGGAYAAPTARPNFALSTNLESHWKMEETTGTRNDSVGTNHLTSNNSVGYTASGKHGNAATFDSASSQYLSIADNTSLSMADIDFTVAAWVNLQNKSSTSPIVAKWHDTGSQYEYVLRYYAVSDRFQLYVSNNSGAFQEIKANNFGSPSTSTWYFIVAYHNSVNNTISISVNNGAVDSVAYSSGVGDSTAPFRIGGNDSNSYASAYIDNVSIWKNRILSSEDITTLYNAGCDYPFTACEATATPTATNTPLPATATNTPLPATATNTPSPATATNTPLPATATNTPTSTYTPNWQTGFALPPDNSLILEYRATVGDIAVTIVGAFLLLVLSLYVISRMFGPWAR